MKLRKKKDEGVKATWTREKVLKKAGRRGIRKRKDRGNEESIKEKGGGKDSCKMMKWVVGRKKCTKRGEKEKHLAMKKEVEG